MERPAEFVKGFEMRNIFPQPGLPPFHDSFCRLEGIDIFECLPDDRAELSPVACRIRIENLHARLDMFSRNFEKLARLFLAWHDNLMKPVPLRHEKRPVVSKARDTDNLLCLRITSLQTL